MNPTRTKQAPRVRRSLSMKEALALGFRRRFRKDDDSWRITEGAIVESLPGSAVGIFHAVVDGVVRITWSRQGEDLPAFRYRIWRDKVALLHGLEARRRRGLRTYYQDISVRPQRGGYYCATYPDGRWEEVTKDEVVWAIGHYSGHVEQFRHAAMAAAKEGHVREVQTWATHRCQDMVKLRSLHEVLSQISFHEKLERASR